MSPSPFLRPPSAFVPCLARALTPSTFTPSLYIRSMSSKTPSGSHFPSPPLTSTISSVLRPSSSGPSPEQPPASQAFAPPQQTLSTTSTNGGVEQKDEEEEEEVYYVDECEETYRLPPREIASLVDAPADPSVSLQPVTKQWMILLEKPNLPPISEVASEELRLAGFRINANTYVPSRSDYYIGMKLQRVDDKDRKPINIKGLPSPTNTSDNGNGNDLHFGYVRWSPNGQKFAFCLYDPLFGLQLWVVNMLTLEAENLLPGIRLHAVCGDPFTWSSDSNTIVGKFVIENKQVPKKPPIPRGPVIQENLSHEPSPSRTFQDLLQTKYDKKLFEYYTSCKLGIIDINTKKINYIGPKSAAYRRASPSPNGLYLLIDIMVPPFVYMLPASRFPRKIQVWDINNGNLITNVADVPLQDKIPIAFDGVGEGPRSIGWRSDTNATLYWAEAQDGGDPNRPAKIRDCIYTLPAPFNGLPRKIASLAWRYSGIVWGSDSVALLSERKYKTRSAKSYLIAPGRNDDNIDMNNDEDGVYSSENYDVLLSDPCCARSCDINQTEAPKRLMFDIPNWEDRYNDPGSVCTTRDERGKTVLRLIYPNGIDNNASGDNEHINHDDVAHIGKPYFLLQGAGASAEGDRPFLSLFDSISKESTMLWRSEPPKFQSIVMVLEEDKHAKIPLKVLIRQESQKENPNFYIVDMTKESHEAFTKLQSLSPEESLLVGENNILYPLTVFPHPAPDLRDVQREIIHYDRADGVRLNASLYLPPGYDVEKDGPLPVFMWAYPREFKSAEFAGQMKGSPHRFVRLARTPLYWLTRGYAILDGPEMPIIGEGDNEANDTYIQQLVSSAEAAVEYLIKRGIGDRKRMAIGGHSYGAFMTVNLLAHTDKLFCCGIARSGAYNRTLTPFGFQSEERTLWEARDVYQKMSPYMFADKINAPLLLVHGDADNNPGTFPLQSERLYQALKGHGKICRYVNLPHEGHGYRARESVMHTLAEMTVFLDKYCNGVDDNFMSEIET